MMAQCLEVPRQGIDDPFDATIVERRDGIVGLVDKKYTQVETVKNCGVSNVVKLRGRC
jgi:hypothetical protein